MKRHGRMIPGSAVVDDGLALRSQLRTMARTNKGMIAHVLRTQRTFRLMKVIPTWTNCITSPFGYELCRALSSDELKRYRSWWEMIFTITTPKQESNRIQLAIAYLAARKATRAYAGKREVLAERFGITDPALAAEIEEAALKEAHVLLP